jgi:hypothetical protein
MRYSDHLSYFPFHGLQGISIFECLEMLHTTIRNKFHDAGDAEEAEISLYRQTCKHF